MNKSLDSQILRYASFALLFFVVLWTLFLVRGALPVFLVGGLLAYVLEPVLQKLEKRGHSRKSAVGVVFLIYLLIFTIFVAALMMAWQQAQGLLNNAETYSQQFTTLVEDKQQHLDELKWPVAAKKALKTSVDRSLKKLQLEIPNYATDALTYGISSIGTVMVTIVLLPLVTLWMMIDAHRFRARTLMLIPPFYRRGATEISQSINELLGRYVRGQIIVCSTYGLLCTIVFEILARVYGMHYPLVLGALAALVYVVPYFGLMFVVLSAGLTAYFTAREPAACAIIAVGGCLLCNLIVDYGISPRVLGKGVGLHPLVIIFALLCGNQIGGPLGMIVAVPLFASLRVVAVYLFPQLAAPLPSESPSVTATAGNSEAGELVRRTQEAEQSAGLAPSELRPPVG